MFLTGVAAALAGCGGKPPVSPTRPRVVSMSPSTTEALYSIGAGGLLVGRSRFCDHPKDVDTLPVVGGFSDPSIEATLALLPTLVVGAQGPAGPSLAEKLTAHGIDTYFPRTESFDEIGQMILGLGARLGRTGEAQVIKWRLEFQLNGVTNATKDRPAPRAVMLFDTAPIVVAGPGSFPDEMMRLARSENLITEGGSYPTIGLERLIALDPDVLLDGVGAGVEGGSPLLAKRDAPGWRSLKALANGRVHALGSTALRPGPRIGEGIRELARALHGPGLVLK